MNDLMVNALTTQKFSFAKQVRLLTPNDFKEVFDGCTFKIHQSHVLWFVRVKPIITDGILSNRMGLAITKKKIKRAHERNRIKRLAREYFRLHQHEFLLPVEMVLIIKQSPESLSNDEVVQQLAASFALIQRKLSSISASIQLQ